MTTQKTQASKKQPPKFVSVLVEVMFDQYTRPLDWMIFCLLRYRQGKNENAWPSIRRIASDLHVSPTSVQRSLGRLIRRGRIVRTYPKQSGPGFSCKYSVGNWEPIVEEERRQRTAFELQLEDEKAKKLAEAINA